MSKPSSAEIKQALSYDQSSGVFTWLQSRRTDRIGQSAGALDSKGHRQIRFGGRLHMAHRLAWVYMTGEWPSLDVDHIDGVRDNNAWANLRLATESQNGANSHLSKRNTSGAKGVWKERSTGRWNAYVQANGKRIYLGTFDTVTEASRAYAEGARKYFGEFARVA